MSAQPETPTQCPAHAETMAQFREDRREMRDEMKDVHHRLGDVERAVAGLDVKVDDIPDKVASSILAIRAADNSSMRVDKKVAMAVLVLIATLALALGGLKVADMYVPGASASPPADGVTQVDARP